MPKTSPFVWYRPFLFLAALMPVAGTASDDSAAVAYQHRSEYGFVRIERIEPGAADNAHPYSVGEAALRRLLAGLRLQGAAKGKSTPVFDDDELAEIVAPLTAALANAKPSQDVTFAVPGAHGRFGKFSPRTITTGRVFARDGKLNLIFGLVHDPFERQMSETGYLPAFTPGSRKARIDDFANILPGAGGLAGERVDWVVLDVKALTTPTETAPPKNADSASAPAPASTNNGYEAIERELDALDRLKADGSITEAEYKERRRALLRRGSAP